MYASHWKHQIYNIHKKPLCVTVAVFDGSSISQTTAQGWFCNGELPTYTAKNRKLNCGYIIHFLGSFIHYLTDCGIFPISLNEDARFGSKSLSPDMHTQNIQTWCAETALNRQAGSSRKRNINLQSFKWITFFLKGWSSFIVRWYDPQTTRKCVSFCILCFQSATFTFISRKESRRWVNCGSCRMITPNWSEITVTMKLGLSRSSTARPR